MLEESDLTKSGVEREASIRTRAYDIWESEGRPGDRHAEHWLQAERELANTPESEASPPRASPAG
jgi:hypothetical protein